MESTSNSTSVDFILGISHEGKGSLILTTLLQSLCLSPIHILSLGVNAALFMVQICKLQTLLKARRQAVSYMLVNLALASLLKTILMILMDNKWFAIDTQDHGCVILMLMGTVADFVLPFSVVGVIMAYVAERVIKRDGEVTALFFIFPAWIVGFCLALPIICIQLTIGNHDSYLYTHLSCLLLGYIIPFINAMVLCCASCVIENSSQLHKWDSTVLYIAIDDCSNDTNGLVPPKEKEYIKSNYLPLIINIVFFVMNIPFMVMATVDQYFPVLYSNLSCEVYMWLYFTTKVSVAVVGAVALIGSLVKIPRWIQNDIYNV